MAPFVSRALPVTQRGVVLFHGQEFDVRRQPDLARHWGSLRKHAIPHEPGLKEVHGNPTG